MAGERGVLKKRLGDCTVADGSTSDTQRIARPFLPCPKDPSAPHRQACNASRELPLIRPIVNSRLDDMPC